MRTCWAALAARCGASVVARSFYLLLTSGPTAPEREKNPTPQRFFSPHPDPPGAVGPARACATPSKPRLPTRAPSMPPKDFPPHELLLALAAEGRQPKLEGMTNEAKTWAQKEWVASWYGPKLEDLDGVTHSEWWKECKRQFKLRLRKGRERFGDDPPDAAAAQAQPLLASSLEQQRAATQLGIAPNLSCTYDWIVARAPNIVDGLVTMGAPILTPNERHVKRTLTAMVGGQPDGRSPKQASIL